MEFVKKWPSRMQEQRLFKSWANRHRFFVKSIKFEFSKGAVAAPRIYLPQKARGGGEGV